MKLISVLLTLGALAWAFVAVLRLPTPGPVALEQLRSGDHAVFAAGVRADTRVTEWRDALGSSLLHWAVVMSDRAAVDVLLEAGADPNARDVRGRTPLHLAAASERGRGDGLIASLVARGADVNAATAEGVTPLQMAQAIERPDLVQPLLAAGATPSVQTDTRLASAGDEADLAAPSSRTVTRLRRGVTAGQGLRRAAAWDSPAARRFAWRAARLHRAPVRDLSAS